MSNFMDKLKKSGKFVVDAGAKQMLKTDIVFLDREIKTRKQAFGIEIYDLMEELEKDDSKTADEKESKIRAVFDAARKDIAVIQAKKDCKKEEMGLLEVQSGSSTTAAAASDIPPSSGSVVTNQHPSESGAPATS